MKHISTQSELQTNATIKPVQPRRGFMSMELVLVLPILMVVLMALFEFSLLFFARSSVVEACRVGARHATYAGVTVEDIENEVKKTLSPKMQEHVQVHAEMGKHSGDAVRVVVSVPMSDASPDLLMMVGFGLEGRYLQSETRMVKE